MEIDLKNPLQKRHHSSDRALIQKYLDYEVEFMVAPGYSNQKNFIAVRSIAILDIKKYTCDQTDAFVPYLAINFFDRFLSSKINIPVVLRGQGFEPNLALFVFCCVSIAFKIRCTNFSFVDFWNKHGVAATGMDVLVMELQILQGLKWNVRPVTAITFVYFILQLLKKENQQKGLQFALISQLIVAIQVDIRFAEFRPSTLAASAILVTSYNLFPEMHSELLLQICSSCLVQKLEVEEFFDAIKEHVITDHILNPENRPKVSKETNKRGSKRNKEKEITIENATQQESVTEITETIEEHDDVSMDFDFDPSWIVPEFSTVDERNSCMDGVIDCMWSICGCFGLNFGSFRYD